MADKYKINPGELNKSTEETTAVSKISYEIENANINDLSNRSITRQMNIIRKNGRFPSNLEYLDSHTDKSTV